MDNMIYDTKYNLKDPVTILELKRPGIIVGFFIGGLGVTYYVRYFNNGELKSEYFYEEELEKQKIEIT